ncbi:hypothetical protein JOL62DRAFT_291634 [Phyllosticta paracitricarpa]|uniref:Uncharacterized protein n=1 Tax=Phyllosticta paracitricarpa TaxID=2016321 RepID=A0ABR1NG68_9PEZI
MYAAHNIGTATPLPLSAALTSATDSDGHGDIDALVVISQTDSSQPERVRACVRAGPARVQRSVGQSVGRSLGARPAACARSIVCGVEQRGQQRKRQRCFDADDGASALSLVLVWPSARAQRLLLPLLPLLPRERGLLRLAALSEKTRQHAGAFREESIFFLFSFFFSGPVVSSSAKKHQPCNGCGKCELFLGYIFDRLGRTVGSGSGRGTVMGDGRLWRGRAWAGLMELGVSPCTGWLAGWLAG